MSKRKGIPEFVYAKSREAAQKALDDSYLTKYEAHPLGTGAERDDARQQVEALQQELMLARQERLGATSRELDEARHQVAALREALRRACLDLAQGSDEGAERRYDLYLALAALPSAPDGAA